MLQGQLMQATECTSSVQRAKGDQGLRLTSQHVLQAGQASARGRWCHAAVDAVVYRPVISQGAVTPAEAGCLSRGLGLSK